MPAPKPAFKYTVLKDTCEQKNYGWEFPESDHCLGTVRKNLFTADYSLDGYYDDKTFVIERKGSVSELVQNITKKEKWDDFKQELERLEEFRWPFVVCEFPFSLLATYPVGSDIPKAMWSQVRIRPAFLLKRIEEIWLTFKTKFVFADSKALAKDVASGLFKRVVERAPIS